MPNKITLFPKACQIFILILLTGPVFLAGADNMELSPNWETRYAHLHDQKPEWTEEGIVHRFRTHYNSEENLLRIEGKPEDMARGWIWAGRSFQVPETLDALPAALEVSLDYKIYESPPDRSGHLYLALFTRERWDAFASRPEDAETIRPDYRTLIFSKDVGWIAMHPIHYANEDVLNWTHYERTHLLPHLRKKLGQELVVALGFVVAHQNVESWADIKNFEMGCLDEPTMWREHFFERLDLERPELSKVGQALEKDDLSAAKTAFIAHMKKREKPLVPNLEKEADPNLIAKADKLARRYFDDHGEPIQWKEKPQWEDNSPNYEQWTIGRNRHRHWVDLGQAYAATGDEKYAKEFVFQAVDFAQGYPYYIGDKKPARFVDGPVVVAGRINLSLNGGNRMGNNWWKAYYFFRNSPHFDVESQMIVLKHILEHADYLMEDRLFNPDGNWAAFETNGLFHCAVLLPEFKDSPLWLEKAEKRFSILLESLVYPDGTPKEISMGYHWANTTFFSDSLRLGLANHVEMDPRFPDTVKRMIEACAYTMTPNFGTIGFGDANWTVASDRIKLGKELFPKHPFFPWFASQGKRGDPPNFVSWSSPWAGWYVMRESWRSDALYLIFDAGPIGASHFHADKLGMVVHVGPTKVLHETSNYAYDGSEMQQYVRGTWSHNTIVVDERIQRSHGMKNHLVTKKKLDNRWVTNADFDFAEGLYNLGYADGEGMSHVAHRREVLFVKPDFWIVVDQLVPEDEEEHDYRALFHLSPEPIEVDEESKTASVSWEGGTFRVRPVQPNLVNLEIVRGQTEPYYLGWLPANGQNKKPSEVAVYQWQAKGPTTQVWLLEPKKTGAGWPLAYISSESVGTSGNVNFILQTPLGEAFFSRCGAKTIQEKSTVEYFLRKGSKRFMVTP